MTNGLEAIPGMSGYAGSDAEPVARTRNRQDLFPADVSTENPPGMTAARGKGGSSRARGGGPRGGRLAPLQALVVDPVLPEEMRQEESCRPAPYDDHVPHGSPFPPTALSYHRLSEMPRFPD